MWRATRGRLETRARILDLWKGNRSSFTPAQAVGVLAISAQVLSYIQPSNPIHREYFEEGARLGRKYSNEVDTASRSACLQNLAESYLSAPGDTGQNYRAAYPLIQEALVLDRADPSHGALLLTSLQTWGRINRFLGHYDQDEAAQREAYLLELKLVGPDHARSLSEVPGGMQLGRRLRVDRRALSIKS